MENFILTLKSLYCYSVFRLPVGSLLQFPHGFCLSEKSRERNPCVFSFSEMLGEENPCVFSLPEKLGEENPRVYSLPEMSGVENPSECYLHEKSGERNPRVHGNSEKEYVRLSQVRRVKVT